MFLNYFYDYNLKKKKKFKYYQWRMYMDHILTSMTGAHNFKVSTCVALLCFTDFSHLSHWRGKWTPLPPFFQVKWSIQLKILKIQYLPGYLPVKDAHVSCFWQAWLQAPVALLKYIALITRLVDAWMSRHPCIDESCN